MVKAGAHDSEIVQALGIDLDAICASGCSCSAPCWRRFAGVIMAPLWGIRPHMGVDAVVPAFLIIVLGGVGSFWGAVFGGLLVGMVVGLSAAYASEWSMLSMYLLLIGVVTFPRPRSVRQEKRAGGLEMTSARSVPVITVAMLVTWLFFASVPLWIEQVGLYQYLGVEILIFAIYALAYNSCSATPACRRSDTAPSSASAPTRSALRSSMFCRTCGSAWRSRSLAAAAGRRCSSALFISHRRGIYYALMTIAFGQVFWFVAIKCTRDHRRRGRPAQDRAAAGRLRHRQPRPEEQRRALLLRARGLRCRVRCCCGGWCIRRSAASSRRSSRTRRAPRFVGYDVWRYKAAVLVLSAGLSGLAGGLFAMAQSSAFPDVMSLHYSGYVVMMTLVGGGLVSFWGPVIGAAVFFLARDVIGAVPPGWMLWFGLFFMVLVLFKPEGIAGIFAERHPARAPGRRAGAAPHPQSRGEPMALFEAHELASALRRPRRARERLARVRGRASSPASWGRTAPARPPASTC